MGMWSSQGVGHAQGSLQKKFADKADAIEHERRYPRLAAGDHRNPDEWQGRSSRTRKDLDASCRPRWRAREDDEYRRLEFASSERPPRTTPWLA